MIFGSIFSVAGRVFSSVWPYLIAIILFLFMIVIHEFGHFIAAKLLGVKVNEFAVGFGPTLLKKQGKETLYSLKAFPLGGYCAMEGEDEESYDGRAFCNKAAWKRLIIIVAGAFMNLLFGLLLSLIIVARTPDYGFLSMTVGGFRSDSVSAQSGLEVGDKIVKVGSRRVLTTYDLSYCLTNIKGNTVPMTVERDGKKVKLDVEFNTKTDDGTGINYVTVDFWLTERNKNVFSVIGQSFKQTVAYGKIVWFSLIDLITGKYGISAMSGPVGVTETLGRAAKTGLDDLLPLIALITVNLGVFNLLPVPALDGGRAFFVFVELAARRPIPHKFESTVHAIGLILLLTFMAFITVKDIVGLL